MDASVSPKVDADISDVCDFLLRFDNASYPTRKRCVMKYTKLPDFDFDTQVSWPQPSSYTLHPRLRRIIEVDDVSLQTTRSLKPNTMSSSRTNSTNYTKRKVVTIENEQTTDTGQMKCTNKATATVLKDAKSPVRSTSRLTNPPKYARVPKVNAIATNTLNKADSEASKSSLRSKPSGNNLFLQENSRFRNNKGTREVSKTPKPTPTTVKINVSKNIVISSESEKKAPIVDMQVENLKRSTSTRQPLEKNRVTKTPPESKSQAILINDRVNFTNLKKRPATVIRVPFDSKDDYKIRRRKGSSSSSETIDRKGVLQVLSSDSDSSVPSVDHPFNKVDRGTDMGIKLNSKELEIFNNLNDVQVETIPPPSMVNQTTETVDGNPANLCKHQDCYIQTELTKDMFDDLDIPNVTLTKDRSNVSKDDIVTISSNTPPNLDIPTYVINSEKDSVKSNVLSINKSYIIGRATFTYTRKQKFDFQVIGSSDDNSSNQSPSPIDYPLNLVSVFKRKLKNCQKSQDSEANSTNKKDNVYHDLGALNCSYVFDSSKLVKPSDLISTLRVNSGLLQNDYICEQFQRELHFIDSFFESLQYLENCSLSETCFSQDKCENWVNKTGLDLKNTDYNSFLSKLENGAGTLLHVDDMETMASKSLCLLNLLIRDEQRRAKNLLFVLKMREDALKDFTKSQIIWLENKKKQENTDVSTLKKKQRGALLKLQHECGEMHRMRKALLTLSEKRKAALMKTRNNIELKLKNNVDVDQILLGKKKLKRNTTADRNVAPLKCFELSSSGCDDSASPKHKLETSAPPHEHHPVVASAEKCVQTGDSILEAVDQETDTAAENFVTVDGTYLNILFQNLSVPQMFSSGKQYEVNEEALRNIVKSSNNVHQKSGSDSDVVEHFMERVKSKESDRSSSPSTAHSLLDEYAQYYKGLGDGGKSPGDDTDTEYQDQSRCSVVEIQDTCAQAVEAEVEFDRNSAPTGSTVSDSVETVLSQAEFLSPVCLCDRFSDAEVQVSRGQEVAAMESQTGPLPVPPGASPEPAAFDTPQAVPSSTETITITAPSVSVVTLASAGVGEAEELRRQQLAIEREIKALEQQQCQLLAVREIPDKPPPPYTPPHQPHAPPRAFALDPVTTDRIESHITKGGHRCESADSFDAFIHDICLETLKRQQTELSDKPWDACNLLPHTQEVSPVKLAQKTIADIKEVLTVATPTVVSGVGSRRSDHIDDILFAEWRRCEPEWTSLHAEEAVVKNQVFESIFQEVLNETIDHYKKTVLRLATEPTE